MPPGSSRHHVRVDTKDTNTIVRARGLATHRPLLLLLPAVVAVEVGEVGHVREVAHVELPVLLHAPHVVPPGHLCGLEPE